MTRQYSEYSNFFQHNENESTIEIQTSLSGSPLRSDGVDETGDANRTLVWVARRTTGRGGQTTIGSIRTHSLRRRNSWRVANAEREVGQPSIGRIPATSIPDTTASGVSISIHFSDTSVVTDTAVCSTSGDIPRKRALSTSDGPDSTMSGSDIPESHADRPPEVEYSERLISRRPQDEGGTEGLCSPNMKLEMAVIRLQKDVDDCHTELELARKHTPAVALRPPRRSGFTSTPVPRYSGKSNWEQYREV